MFAKIVQVLVGNTVAQAINFLGLVYISKCLSLNQYGVFSAIIASHMLCVQMADLGLNVAFLRLAKKSAIKLQYSSVFLLKIGISFLLTFVLIFTNEEIGGVLKIDKKYSVAVMYALISAPMYIIYYTINAYVQSLGGYIRSSVYSSIISIVRLFLYLMIEFLEFENKIEYFVFSYVIPVIIPLVIQAINENHTIKKLRISRIFIWKLIKISKWTMGSSFLVTFVAQFSLLFVSKYSSETEAGVFSIANNFAMVVPLITNAVFLVILNEKKYYEPENMKRPYFEKIKKMAYLIPLLAVLIGVIAYIIFRNIYSDTVHKIWMPFFIIVIGYLMGVIASPLSLLLLNEKNAHILFMVNFGQAVILLLLSESLVGDRGAVGMALIVALMNIFGLVVIVISTKKLIYK